MIPLSKRIPPAYTFAIHSGRVEKDDKIGNFERLELSGDYNSVDYTGLAVLVSTLLFGMYWPEAALY